ncbi:DUF1634 domain-containing protein [Sphingobacterium griseoflavum]|uniref:DUF1634 domain-containing protein n=1 Tax=Sphingobacterium griseoflavum TaxID=1474952 RepID=A0ABQ3HV26_9SPHI|nr:DUF1634 domain-containing protein [Sphingobacterium griseoflavum]GHE30456.1 hypothetical protein GCM10017764_11710 [Sphingobacterium griseoflavum]
MKITDKTIQYIIGNLLKYSVWIVLGIGILGGALFLINNKDATVDYRNFIAHDQSLLEVLDDVFSGIANFDGAAVIYLAVILLFLTPLIRLLLSLVGFMLEKDGLYVAITLTVLAIVSFSVYFGFAH